MEYVKIAGGMLVLGALGLGAHAIGIGLGFEDPWAWWVALPIYVAALLLLDPQTRRSK